MKNKITFLLFLSSFSLFSQTVSKKISALFLGNSYTYANNLPQLISDIALANGDTLYYDSNTPGGYTLQNHAGNTTSITKINSQKWDHIILQAQSQEPSIDPLQVAAQTTPYALKLDSMIKQSDSCTITTFYETWGRKYGDAGNCGMYPPVCTYAGMQDRLKQSYKLFADTTTGIMAPTGEAFRFSRQLDSTIDLYQPDQSHPSLAGSYLAACVFYEVLFHKNVANTSYWGGLSGGVALFLQQVAHATVTDSLSIWNLGVNVPYAPFTFTATNLQYQFNASDNFNHQWYFGDGSTSAQSDPLYTYGSSQTYTVSHVVNNDCVKDSFVMVILAGVSGMENEYTEKLSLYPSPASEFVHLSLPASCKKIMVHNALGIAVKEIDVPGTTPSIFIGELAPGCYFIQAEGFLQRIKFIKE